MSTDQGTAASRGPAAVPDAASAPWLRVMRGRPSAQELAALTVVLLARSRTGAAPVGEEAPAAHGWSAHWRSAGAPLPPGPGAWVASARR